MKKCLKSNFLKALYEVEFKFEPPAAAYEYFENDGLKKKYNGMSYDEVWEKRNKYLSPSVATFEAFSDRPFYNTRGRMQYIYDEEGRPYLDFLAQNQTISVGHNHPAVFLSALEQMSNIIHSTTMYYNDAAVATAEKLVNKLPEGEDWVVHFVNSGAEAIDLALLLARTYTGSFDILAIRNAYHGLLSKSMDLTCLSKCKQSIPHGFGVKHVVKPDEYRGIWGYDDPEAGLKYADDVYDTIFYETCGSVAGFIFEPIQGYGGVCILPPGYVEKSSEIVRDAGGLIIADEIQTGFGRTGENYWGFEMHNIVPDVITFAKGFGNGFPLAAVAAKREICEPMSKKSYFNTYGGNPTITAVGGAVIDTVDNDMLQENSKFIGIELKDMFKKLQKKHPVIGDCRGIGLMQGVEICYPFSKKPYPELCTRIFEILRDNGIIPGKGGTYGNVFRINPPMCISKEDVEWTEKVYDHALQKAEKEFNINY